MEPVVIRPAQPSDATDLARNWVDVARHYVELDADAFQLPAADGLVAWFQELLHRPRSGDAVWLVAEVDGRVVGDVAARLEHPTEVGARLMHAVEEWGRGKGAVRCVLTTYHASPLSVPFYQQGMGYQRREIVFEKRLD
jgi:GNAT superfamily N-acetyltransferase